MILGCFEIPARDRPQAGEADETVCPTAAAGCFSEKADQSLGGGAGFRRSVTRPRSHERKTIPGRSVSCDGNRGVRGRTEPPERRLQPGLAAPLGASESTWGRQGVSQKRLRLA
jgi:hypothetical protein